MSRFGLTIYFSKTTIQAFNNKEVARVIVILVVVGGNLRENLLKFTYLAETFYNRKLSPATDFHVSKAIGKFVEIKQVLMDCKINMAKKMRHVSDGGMCQNMYVGMYVRHVLNKKIH